MERWGGREELALVWGCTYVKTYRYRVSERHACPVPVNVNYCGIGSPGCCKRMIHGWRKGPRERKHDCYGAL